MTLIEAAAIRTLTDYIVRVVVCEYGIESTHDLRFRERNAADAKKAARAAGYRTILGAWRA